MSQKIHLFIPTFVRTSVPVFTKHVYLVALLEEISYAEPSRPE
jgi:hypothetical protein